MQLQYFEGKSISQFSLLIKICSVDAASKGKTPVKLNIKQNKDLQKV
jgi:hypothetical protein